MNITKKLYGLLEAHGETPWAAVVEAAEREKQSDIIRSIIPTIQIIQ